MSTLRMPTAHPRPLAEADLGAVNAIDAALSGRTRRAYFDRRLAAAQRDPERHLQFAVEEDGALAGFMLGRLLEGEFGRSEPGARLEAFGVRAAAQGRGLAAALSAAFEDAARKRGAREIRTTARWREHALLRFLDRRGYALAGSHVLERRTGDDLTPEARDAMPCATLAEGDLEGIARIDRRHTGHDRRAFLRHALGEALEDSAVRVSLAVRVDGGVAGFLMARVDYGDFGRAEPAAVIDAVGVDPLRARQGIGRALLSQLLINLRGLGVERVETIVPAVGASLPLAGFFYAAGFGPSERIAFSRRL